MTDSWHILRVRPGTELSVAERLLGAYVPTFVMKRFNRRLRKSVFIQMALIPGYVFMQNIFVDGLSVYRHIPDVSGLMRNTDRSPAMLRAKDMVLLRELEKEANQPKPGPFEGVVRYVVGQTVKIPVLRDRFAMAVVQKIRGNQILAEVVGSHLRLEVAASRVSAA